jgi:hypothetical protein
MDYRRQTQGGHSVRGRSLLRRAATLACAALLMGAAGCGPQLSKLSFRVDKRVHFVTPKDRSLVHAPLTIRWTIRDFTLSAPATGPTDKHVGYFAVFVDRAPIKPGQTLKVVASDDRACQREPTCPDAAYLALRQIYTTTTTSVTLPRVAPLVDNGDKTQLHEVTIVLLDTSGHRIGESAWHITFKMKKPTF